MTADSRMVASVRRGDGSGAATCIVLPLFGDAIHTSPTVKNLPLRSASGMPIQFRSRSDGGLHASPTLLDCCLPTVQQLTSLIA